VIVLRVRPWGGSLERRGFTLLEVVIALLVVELAVIGGVGIMVLASATLTRAERLQTASASAQAVLDTLMSSGVMGDGTAAYTGGELRWQVEESGEVALWAVDPVGDTLFRIASIAPPPSGVP
jgi:type II secretory pathway pseudopilin PulG